MNLAAAHAEIHTDRQKKNQPTLPHCRIFLTVITTNHIVVISILI